MNNNTFDWKEIQEAAIKCFKEHPIGTLVALFFGAMIRSIYRDVFDA